MPTNNRRTRGQLAPTAAPTFPKALHSLHLMISRVREWPNHLATKTPCIFILRHQHRRNPILPALCRPGRTRQPTTHGGAQTPWKTKIGLALTEPLVSPLPKPQGGAQRRAGGPCGVSGVGRLPNASHRACAFRLVGVAPFRQWPTGASGVGHFQLDMPIPHVPCGWGACRGGWSHWCTKGDTSRWIVQPPVLHWWGPLPHVVPHWSIGLEHFQKWNTQSLRVPLGGVHRRAHAAVPAERNIFWMQHTEPVHSIWLGFCARVGSSIRCGGARPQCNIQSRSIAGSHRNTGVCTQSLH